MKIDKFIIIILFLVSCNTYNTSWERNKSEELSLKNSDMD